MRIDTGRGGGEAAERGGESPLSVSQSDARVRALFVADSLVVGGAERVVQALLEDLPAHGVACRLACLRRLGEIGETLREAGVATDEQLITGARDPRGGLRLRALARQYGAQLLYLLDHSNALFHGRLAARWLGLPSLVAVHRTGRADGSRSLSFADRLLLPWTAKVIAVSDGHARYLREREGVPAEKLVTVFNGVDPQRFAGIDGERVRRELGLPRAAAVACQIAALRPEKHHALSLSALASLPAPERPLLLLVGDGPERSAVERDVARRGLAPWVRLLGHREDIPELLAASDLLILSSHPRVETFPLCVLEAMAAGRAVVATDVGSLREMVVEGETAVLTSPGDVLAFAGALRDLLGHRARREAMGAAGRERLLRNFTRAQMVERTAGLIREVVAR